MTRRTQIGFIVLLLLFLALRIPYLGWDLSNSDAARWHRRSERFLTAVKQMSFGDTYQHYQPGVTLMWLGAVIKQVTHTYSLTENADYYPIIHGYIKTALVIILFIILIIQSLLIRKLFGNETSLFYIGLMAVEPYLIGIDRWMHLTSLETYLAFTAFLLILYWRKNSKTWYLVLSSVFLSLAFLSKLTSLSVLPLIFLVIYFRERKINGKFIQQGLLFLAGFFVTSILLFPALWVQLIEVLMKLFSAISGAVGDDIRGQYFTGWFSLVYYVVILAFKLSPITLSLLLFALLIRKHLWKNYQWIYIYFLFSLLVLTVSEKKIDRYSIFLFPSLILLSAAAMSLLNKYRYILYAGIFLYTVCVVYFFYPVYSAYYSPAFGGTQQAIKVGVYENSGEYFSDAAFYLNTLGRDNYLYVPNNYESISYFYKGKMQREYNDQTTHMVTSLDFDRPLAENRLCPQLVKSFGSRDMEVVFVWKCR